MNLPDFRQEGNWDCGRVVFRILCRHWQTEPDAKLASLANPVVGLAPDSLWSALITQGFRVLMGSLTVDLLRDLTKRGIPVACLIQMDGCGHWVVVSGVRRGKVHFQCPLRGPSAVPIAQWETDWIDSHWSGGQFHQFGIAAFL